MIEAELTHGLDQTMDVVTVHGQAYKGSSGVRGDVEMDDTSAVVSQHQEHIQGLDPDGRHGEEIDRCGVDRRVVQCQRGRAEG